MSGHDVSETLQSRPLVAEGRDDRELGGRQGGRRGGCRGGGSAVSSPGGCLRHSRHPVSARWANGVSLTLSLDTSTYRCGRRAAGNFPAGRVPRRVLCPHRHPHSRVALMASPPRPPPPGDSEARGGRSAPSSPRAQVSPLVQSALHNRGPRSPARTCPASSR